MMATVSPPTQEVALARAAKDAARRRHGLPKRPWQRARVVVRLHGLYNHHPDALPLLLAWADAVAGWYPAEGALLQATSLALGAARRRHPRNRALRDAWAEAVALRMGVLQRQKRWSPLASQCAEAEAVAEGQPPGGRLAWCAARAALARVHAALARDDVAGAEAAFATLTTRVEASARAGGAWPRPFRALWAKGARKLVAAWGDASWDWGEAAVVWKADAASRLAQASALVDTMGQRLGARPTQAEAVAYAEALQGYGWVVRQRGDTATEDGLYQRLVGLARRFPGTAVEGEWAHGAASRALAWAGDVDRFGAVCALCDALSAAAARQPDDGVLREAWAKGLAARTTALDLAGRPRAAFMALEALADLVRRHPAATGIVRSYAVAAKAQVARWMAQGETAWARRALQRMDTTLRRAPGEGLGPRVYAQALDATMRANPDPHLRGWALTRLARIVAENPGNAALHALWEAHGVKR